MSTTILTPEQLDAIWLQAIPDGTTGTEWRFQICRAIEQAVLQSEQVQAWREAEDVMRRNGFVKCDISICNCGSWHARYGLPERMQEIEDALADAGHPLSNDNGNLVINALNQFIEEAQAWKRDAERYRWATALDDNAETLYSIVLSYGGDRAKINERVDAYRPDAPTKEQP